MNVQTVKTFLNLQLQKIGSLFGWGILTFAVALIG